jgi:hypothetical protein
MTLIGSATFIKYYDAHPSRALNWALLDEGKDLGKERASILPTCICKLAKIARAAAEQSKTLEKITVRGPQAVGKHQNILILLQRHE